MKRDPKLSKLIRESGLIHAPDNFTDQVMGKIAVAPFKSPIKPLIGRGGQIVIILSTIGIVVASLVTSEPKGTLFEKARGFSGLELKLPQINFSLDFFSEINISTWLVSTIVALFLLVLADAGLNRRKKLV